MPDFTLGGGINVIIDPPVPTNVVVVPVQGSSAAITDATVAVQVGGGPETKAALDETIPALVEDDASATALAIAAKIRSLLEDGLTYNTDGTIATSTLGGVTTTYTYNTDGTIATEARDGKTKTYAYTAGVLTGSTVA